MRRVFLALSLVLLVSCAARGDQSWAYLVWISAPNGIEDGPRQCSNCDAHAGMDGVCMVGTSLDPQGYPVGATFQLHTGLYAHADCLAFVAASSSAFRVAPAPVEMDSTAAAPPDTMRTLAQAISLSGRTWMSETIDCNNTKARYEGDPSPDENGAGCRASCDPVLPPPAAATEDWSKLQPTDSACACSDWRDTGQTCTVPATGQQGKLMGRTCTLTGCGNATYCQAPAGTACVNSTPRAGSCGGTSPDDSLTCPANQQIVNVDYDCGYQGQRSYCQASPSCAPDYAVSLTGSDLPANPGLESTFVLNIKSLNGWAGTVDVYETSGLSAAFMAVRGLPGRVWLNPGDVLIYQVSVIPSGQSGYRGYGIRIEGWHDTDDGTVIRSAEASFDVKPAQ